MDVRKNTLEKAFELARSGKCLTIEDVVRRLNADGYNADQIQGRVLRKQLWQLIRAAKSSY
jgi:phosphohistidine phosphatase SixA